MTLYGDLASHARSRARQLRNERDAATYYRQAPEDPTDVVAMASHRAQLKKDARKAERSQTGVRRDTRTVGEALHQEATTLGLPTRPEWTEHLGRSQSFAVDTHPVVSRGATDPRTPWRQQDTDNPSSMARRMLEQRASQNEEMDAWKNILNDRRRRG